MGFNCKVKDALQTSLAHKSVNTLQAQLRTRVQEIAHLAASFQDKLTALQRDTNRSFARTIKSEMCKTYEDCSSEHGKITSSNKTGRRIWN
jgi:hypothetical protein